MLACQTVHHEVARCAFGACNFAWGGGGGCNIVLMSLQKDKEKLIRVAKGPFRTWFF